MKNLFGILFITLATYKNGVYCKGNIYENHTLVGLIPSSEDQLMNLISFENPSKDILVMKPSRAVKDSYDLLVPPDSMKVIKEYANEHKLGFEVKKKNYGRSFQPLEREPKRRSGGKGFNLFNFNSHGAMQEFIDQIAKKHPDLVTLENVGQSYEKRRMRLVKISSKPSNLNPVIFIDAGIHSREWVAPAMAMYLINRLTNDPESRKSDLKNVDWYILPLVNPDGYEYTRTSLNNRMWRKTRSPHGKCFGVDGNRNYDYKWASSGVSHDPCDSEIFAGPSAFSEVETRTVRNIMKKYASRIKLYVSLHAYGQYLVYPWGYTGNFLPDNWRKLHKFAKSASNAVVEAGGDEFTVMSAGQWYPAAGASDDYSFGAVGIPYAYTMELTKGHDFVYPSSLLRKVLPQFYAGFKSFGEQIRNEFSPAAKQVKHVRKGSKNVKEVIKKPQEPSKNSGEDYDVKIKVED